MRSMESDKVQALWMRWVCSMYSVSRWRKLRGSLNSMGIVILDSSCDSTARIQKTHKKNNRKIITCTIHNICIKRLHINNIEPMPHHANAFLQYAPHTVVVLGGHGSRQGFPVTNTSRQWNQKTKKPMEMSLRGQHGQRCDSGPKLSWAHAKEVGQFITFEDFDLTNFT